MLNRFRIAAALYFSCFSGRQNFDIAREGWIADFNDLINMLEMWTTVSGNNDAQFGR